MYITEIILSN